MIILHFHLQPQFKRNNFITSHQVKESHNILYGGGSAFCLFLRGSSSFSVTFLGRGEAKKMLSAFLEKRKGIKDRPTRAVFVNACVAIIKASIFCLPTINFLGIYLFCTKCGNYRTHKFFSLLKKPLFCTLQEGITRILIHLRILDIEIQAKKGTVFRHR